MEEKLILNKLEAEKGVLKVQNENLEQTALFYKKEVELTGTIQAVGNFIEKRTKHDKLKVHVLYSYLGLFLKLRTDEDAGFTLDGENNEPFYLIEGKLVVNPEIKQLQVNTKHKFGVKELTDHLRFAKYFFADKDAHTAIVSNLQKFKVSAQKFIETQDDTRGNVKDYFEIKNDSNIDLGFDLLMPIYIGQPAKKFRVEIGYNVREKTVEVWMDSPELADLLKESAIAIIDAELARLPKEFVFIEQ